MAKQNRKGTFKMTKSVNHIGAIGTYLLESITNEEKSLSARASCLYHFMHISVKSWLTSDVIESKDLTTWLKELCEVIPGFDWANLAPDLDTEQNKRARDMFREVAFIAHFHNATKKRGGVFCDEKGQKSDVPVMTKKGRIYRLNKNVPNMDVDQAGMFVDVSFAQLSREAKENFKKPRENQPYSKLAGAIATILACQEKDVNEISGDAIPMLGQLLDLVQTWNDQIDAGDLDELEESTTPADSIAA